ncbi:TonB-dependent receptor [Fulvivirga sp. RKSG066]|uniref:outer membrane beta-barrel protein n=1 Tax=Fulvivirga aurantia TaxID=2529383 RepID=UPI0012BD26BC|nr:outer membrane beta-barrel protein [Fulvivirga aurantia]MTI22211.1 TonB-dependent receptor [Fulvivirga aurantia]
MKKVAFWVVVLMYFSHLSAVAQDQPLSVSGVLLDATDKSPLVGATVLMVNVKDSLRSKYAIADVEGRFHIKNLEQAFYKLQISNVGYKPYTKLLRVTLADTKLGTIAITPDVKALNEVIVQGAVVAVEQIGDTTQYNAMAYKTNPDASAKDLVSKMPGIVVDSDGVTANGETVEQVLLDGKRFFGQDPLLSLNTIPADIVDKVQVYDEESDQARLTGFDDGNTTKTMNVVTKEDRRNGQFGKLYAGIGEDGLYKSGATLNSFSKDQRITFLGMSNNINQQNFGSEDLIGVSGGGGRGGRRGSNQSFMTGTQDGITKTHSTGLNFTDDLSEKTTFEGSYFFNQSLNNNDQLLNRETFLGNSSQFYTEDQQAASENINHRVNIRANHQFDENNSLLIRSAFSYQNNEGEEVTLGQTKEENGALLSQTYNNYQSVNSAYNFTNSFIYQHKFKKIGRTISFDVNTRINPTSKESVLSDLELDTLTEYSTEEKHYTVGSRVTYTEPIGTTAQLAIGYEINHTSRKSDKETYTLSSTSEVKTFSESLSNSFESSYTKNLPSIRYSNNKYGNIFDVSVAYQFATLNNDQLLPTEEQTSRNFSNVLPSLLARFDIGNGGNFFVRYATSTTEPSVSQLQNVIDNSDPLFLSLGNSNLDQSYSHSLQMRLQKNNFDKNITFANMTSVTNTSDYIGTGTTVITADSVTAGGVTLANGAQVSSPVNLDGYWALRNNTAFGVLLSPIKNNLNISAGLSYVRVPGVINDVVNMANTYAVDLKLGLASNISENVDYNIYYQVAGSRVLNSIESESNTQYYTQTFGSTLNLIFPKGFVFRNETLFNKYKGANESFDTDYTLWNMSVAKKFLKDDRGELELSVFDLLGENQSFDQQVTAQYIEESQTQVLQRYFMLTFTYQLRIFN